MTSPRQRKKRLAALKFKQKQEEQLLKQNMTLEVKDVEIKKEEPAMPVEVVATPVVESESKPKKTKNGLVEMKAQEQVVEQPKVEVKTQTKE